MLFVEILATHLVYACGLIPVIEFYE